jgi:hypothetical protein
MNIEDRMSMWAAKRPREEPAELMLEGAQEIADLRLHVSETYTKKSEVDTLRGEMDKRFDRLEQMIARLYDKIDAKADK